MGAYQAPSVGILSAVCQTGLPCTGGQVVHCAGTLGQEVHEWPVNVEQGEAGKRRQEADLQTEREVAGWGCWGAGLSRQWVIT